ncbi:MAG TPA: succinate dehydrogenase, cytochrome b556 subunit [Acetobacteraceae bacterium]|nr:succinate dehydrogenase, cytochrome b556 subunit [Acetobacteraceae bacterium]
MTDIRDTLLVAQNSEGKRVLRPLSPHLQIYRPQISSMLSITHRATGIALSIGTLLLTWWLVAAATSDSAFAGVQGFIGSWFGVLLLFGWSAALYYHLLAGIRHLGWDAGYGFEIPRFHQTGYAVLIGTAVLTVLTWIVIAVVA